MKVFHRSLSYGLNCIPMETHCCRWNHSENFWGIYNNTYYRLTVPSWIYKISVNINSDSFLNSRCCWYIYDPICPSMACIFFSIRSDIWFHQNICGAHNFIPDIFNVSRVSNFPVHLPINCSLVFHLGWWIGIAVRLELTFVSSRSCLIDFAI